MKTRIKKLLKKIPFAYGIARFFYGMYASAFVHSKDINKAKRNIRIFREMASVVQDLKLNRAEFVDGRIVLELHDGTRFMLRPERTNPLLNIPLSGYFEDSETAFLKGRIKPSWAVIDVGANFGWYTVHFSKAVGRTGKVHSFEPVPEAFGELKENAELNSCAGNVVLNNMAVGKADGKLDLFVPEDSGTAFASEHHSGRKVTATLTMIDSYVKKMGIVKVDLIKADVEGGEMGVLLGAEDTLNRDHPDLFLEVQDIHTIKFGYLPRELFGFLVAKGYSIYFLGPDGKLHELEDYEVLPGYNFYCSVNG